MRMSHGSELPKVTSVYLETAEPIDWNSTMKVCAMKDDFASHRIYIVQAVAAWGKFRRRYSRRRSIQQNYIFLYIIFGKKTPILRLERL